VLNVLKLFPLGISHLEFLPKFLKSIEDF